MILLLSVAIASVAAYFLLKPRKTMNQFRRFSSEKTVPKFCSTPYTLPCGITLQNRVIKAATTEALAECGNPEQRLQTLYRTLSSNNIGLIITGNVMVDRKYLERAGNVIFDEKTDLNAVKEWAKACTVQSPCIVQLNHPGRQANPILNPTTVAPSAVPIAGKTPRALTLEEIQTIIELFSNASKIAVEAGFHGVQIHAAHGYLLSQFLSPDANRRTDQYGGSLENRSRLLLEIISQVRKTVGKEKIVSVKLNSSDFTQSGFSHEDALEVIKLLCKQEMIDLIELSGGNYESIAMVAGSPNQSTKTQQREGYFREFSSDATKTVASFSHRPAIMLTGGMRTLSVIEKVLEDKEADFIGIARPFALEPSLADDLINGKVIGASLLSPPSHNKSIMRIARTLFALGETSWYCEQNRRIGEGKQPDPEMSVTAAIFKSMFRDIKASTKK